MATPLHPDPSRRVRPLKTSEVREMRLLANDGLSATEIGAEIGRHPNTVQRHCPGLLQGRKPARYLEILTYKERTKARNWRVAERFGYATDASVAVVLCRARKLRAAGRLS